MAILTLEDGTVYTQLEDIGRELASLNVKLNRWPVGNDPQIRDLLAKKALLEQEKELVLQLLEV